MNSNKNFYIYLYIFVIITIAPHLFCSCYARHHLEPKCFFFLFFPKKELSSFRRLSFQGLSFIRWLCFRGCWLNSPALYQSVCFFTLMNIIFQCSKKGFFSLNFFLSKRPFSISLSFALPKSGWHK